MSCSYCGSENICTEITNSNMVIVCYSCDYRYTVTPNTKVCRKEIKGEINELDKTANDKNK